MSEKYRIVETVIDQMGSFWSRYKGNSIGRANHYLYHICGLHIAERVQYGSNGIVTLYGEYFATIDWTHGYPSFDFHNKDFNKSQKLLLSKELSK